MIDRRSQKGFGRALLGAVLIALMCLCADGGFLKRSASQPANNHLQLQSIARPGKQAKLSALPALFAELSGGTTATAPALSYATYLGGSDVDSGSAIAQDSSGNIYVAGSTNSANFPATTGALRDAKGSGDVFIAKMNAAGTVLIYCAVFGGSDADGAMAIAVDGAGNAYVTGTTTSTNFPTTPGALQTTFNGGDAFVAKLNPAGTALVYSTYLGGSGNEVGNSITVDNTGNVYVTGRTSSLTSEVKFPTTQGAFQVSPGGGPVDAFLAKLNATGTGLVYSTYLGGDGTEIGYSIAVDSLGNAYVTGSTGSGNFPTTPGAYQRQLSTGTLSGDVFVTKLNTAGSALVYSTYLGGSGIDTGFDIALDSTGNAYITGETAAFGPANTFPTTQNVFQTTFGGGAPATDAFVAKLNAAGAALIFSTYLGGNGADRGLSIAIDSTGNAYVSGLTGSTNFAITPGGLGYSSNVDAFVAELNPVGTALAYFTYFGGGGNDQGSGIALDAANNIYVAGNTASGSFPTTPGALQLNLGGTQDAFIFKLGSTTGFKTVASVSAASYIGPSLAREAIIAAFGTQLATQTVVASDADPNTPGIQLPTSLAGTRVLVKDNLGAERAAPLFFVSPGQINYQIPPGTSNGGTLVTVVGGDGTVSLGTIQTTSVSPGLFSADGTGQGVVAGYALRVKQDGSQITEAINQLDAQNRPITRPIDLGPSTEQVFLVLFGTGFRLRRDPPMITVKIGGDDARVDYAKEQGGFIGLDQLNLLLPRSLMGRGKVNVVLTVEGKTANAVMIEVK